jgi:Cys-rich repeat protein
MKRTTTITLATLTVISAALACGDESGMQIASRYVKSETIGSSGGQVMVAETDSQSLAGVALDIPAGALAEDTRITIEPVDDLALQSDVEWAGPAVRFGPDGLQFDQPASMTLTLGQSLDGFEPAVRAISADGTAEWIESVTDNGDGTVSFAVEHFTRFQPGRRAPPPECTSDRDCSPSETCDAGTCTPRNQLECTTDADCAAGEACTAAGTCAPAPECRTDSDCPRGETCDSGSCEAPTGGCTTDADCAAGEACTAAGTCAPAPECRADAECARGELCVQNACVPNNSGQCTTDRDCAANESCNNGRCVAPRTCQTARDCGPGQQCVRNLCI